MKATKRFFDVGDPPDRHGPHIPNCIPLGTRTNKRVWLTEHELLHEFSYLSPRARAWQLQRRAKNGLAPYVKIKSSRRLIHTQGYAEWVRSETAASNNEGGQS